MCRCSRAVLQGKELGVVAGIIGHVFLFTHSTATGGMCTAHCPTNRQGVVLGDLARLKDLGHFRSCFSLRCEEWSFGPSDPIEEKWCEGASERAAGPNESNLSECDATGRKERERGARTSGENERKRINLRKIRSPLFLLSIAACCIFCRVSTGIRIQATKIRMACVSSTVLLGFTLGFYFY